MPNDFTKATEEMNNDEGKFHPQGYVPKVGEYVGGINSDGVEPAQVVSIEAYRFHANTGGFFHKNHFKKDSSSGIRVYKESPYKEIKKAKGLPDLFTRVQAIRKVLHDEMRNHPIQYQDVLIQSESNKEVAKESDIVETMHTCSRALWELINPNGQEE